MIKLFSLELKNDDHIALASKVRAIMHDIKSIGVKIYIPLIAYVKALYTTSSHYLESLQESGNLKDITFDSLENNFVEIEKDFGKNIAPQSIEEVACLAWKLNNHAHDSSRGRGG